MSAYVRLDETADGLTPVEEHGELPHFPQVVVTDRWVSVQFHEYGPILILDDSATVTERFTIPASNVAQLPLDGAA